MAKKSALLYPVLLLAILSAIVVVALMMTVFSRRVNMLIFGVESMRGSDDKLSVFYVVGFWIASYLFALGSLIMSLRIVTGKITPASGNDSFIIGLLNRVIVNTIEQTIIFAGLYAPLVLQESEHSARLGSSEILSFAAVFLVGRITYGFGYIIGENVGIPTLRSFGFAMVVTTNILLITHHLGFNLLEVFLAKVGPPLHSIF